MNTENSVDWRQIGSPKSVSLLLIGVICAVVSFKGFMIPNHFIDGGVTGLSILLSETFHINIAIPLVLFNLPFILIGYKKIGRTFAIQSLIALVLLALGLQFIEIPSITEDKILTAIFGGIFIGLGIGFVIRSGGVIDGLEIIALYSTKNSKFSTQEMMLGVASILFVLLGIEFGWDKSMYSILTFFTAIQTADYVVDGFEQYTSITIVSKEYDKVKELLVKDYKKGISVFKGERGYLPNNFELRYDCDIVVAVITRLEVTNLQKSIYEIDPKAFMFIQNIREVKGGIVKQLRSH